MKTGLVWNIIHSQKHKEKAQKHHKCADFTWEKFDTFWLALEILYAQCFPSAEPNGERKPTLTLKAEEAITRQKL